MKFVEKAGIRYLQFSSLLQHSIHHGVVTRHGGVSPEPWASLNTGSTVGDDQARVRKNLDLLMDGCDIEPNSVFDVWQVHGNNVVCTTVPRNPSSEHQKADGILTNTPRITLFMRFADCTPIILYDPEKNVVGLVHAGWQGTVKKIPSEAVKRMTEAYHSDPKDIKACIGPSIGPEDYEVGEEVIQSVNRSFPDGADSLLRNTRNGHAYFDLWRANEISLRESGVESIEIAGISTAANTQDWFSHRHENGKTGRFAAFITLG